MVVNYTTIRSVDGLTQEDLRDTSISGTYTDNSVVIDSGIATYAFVIAGVTTNWASATWLWDTNADFQDTTPPLPVQVGGPGVGDRVTNLNTSILARATGFLAGFLVTLSNPGNQTTPLEPYLISRVPAANTLNVIGQDFTLVSPPFPVVPGDTVVNLDTSDEAAVSTVDSATKLTLDAAIMSSGASYEIRRGSASGDPGLLLLDVVPDGKGFRYIFTDEPTS